MSDDFDQLIAHLQADYASIDPPYIHGLLTGYSTTPDPDLDKLGMQVTGMGPLAGSHQEDLVDMMDFLSEDLSLHEFSARFNVDCGDEPERWINGYLKAVDIHADQWREENECHPKAAAALAMLHGLINNEIGEALRIEQPGAESVREDPELVTELVTVIYQEFHGDLDGPIDSGNASLEDMPPLPVYSVDALARMDEQALLAVISSNEDRLPLEVVQECARRASAMVPLLSAMIENDANWQEDASDDIFWTLMHAIFILGLIPGEASANALLEGFRRINFDSNNNFTDWFSGNWPALCRNKIGYIRAPMREIALDRQLGWYPRTHAVACVVANGSDEDPGEQEKALDWLAALCRDESEDEEFRVTAGQTLLDHPRERHRQLLKELVELQDPDSWLGNHFDYQDIDRAFQRGDEPEWRRFDNPWTFYEPAQILQRQRRWLSEAMEQEQAMYGLHDDDLRAPVETYVRDHIKIGRNDPCPCGSGKKYKKCCLN